MHTAGVVQRDYVKITTGYQSQFPLPLHFGLGSNERIDRLEVFGQEEKSEYLNLAANQKYLIEEGRSDPEKMEMKKWSGSRLGQRLLPADSLIIGDRLFSGENHPLITPGSLNVVNFWAPWCKPCVKEMPELKRLVEKHSGVRFHFVSVERNNFVEVKEIIRKRDLLDAEHWVADGPLLEAFFEPAVKCLCLRLLSLTLRGAEKGLL